LEALRQRHPAHRFGCPSAWRLAAKHVLATPSTPQDRTSRRPRQAGARHEMTPNGDRCVQITPLEAIHLGALPCHRLDKCGPPDRKLLVRASTPSFDGRAERQEASLLTN